MSILVKVCGLKEQPHVRHAVDAGAGAVGFVFAASPRRIAPAAARAISENLPSHVRRVAVMLHPSNEEWLAVLEQFAPDVLQADAGDFETLQIPAAVERWPVYREGQAAPDTDGRYVYEGANSGQGKTVDWSTAARLARRGNMLLAGGLNAGNVATAIRAVRPFGVDASSGLESAPGKKDPERITDFINAVRAAEKNL